MSYTYDDRQPEIAVLQEAFPALTEDARICRIMAGALRERLTPLQRQALLLHYVKGKSVSEIARMRGVCPSTVWRTLQRAKDELAWAMRLGGICIRD